MTRAMIVVSVSRRDASMLRLSWMTYIGEAALTAPREARRHARARGCRVLCSQQFCAAFSERVGANTDTAWRTALCMATSTSTSGLTAPCRGCLVRFFLRGDKDFEHPRGTFQLTMNSPGQARRPKSNATPSVGAPDSISLHDAAPAQRDSRRPHIARRRINLFSGGVVLVQCFVACLIRKRLSRKSWK